MSPNLYLWLTRGRQPDASQVLETVRWLGRRSLQIARARTVAGVLEPALRKAGPVRSLSVRRRPMRFAGIDVSKAQLDAAIRGEVEEIWSTKLLTILNAMVRDGTAWSPEVEPELQHGC